MNITDLHITAPDHPYDVARLCGASLEEWGRLIESGADIEAITCPECNRLWLAMAIAAPDGEARCGHRARRGTGEGICDRLLDGHGQCDRAGDHIH